MSKELFDIEAFRAQPLPTEEELITEWGGLDYKVTVCCICFNHEKYIQDSLQGFFSQKTQFAFKVLIYDDLSTDMSRKIITKWQNKYPKIIETVFPKENQHSKGNRPLYFLLPKVNTPYIAFCEGDDYWCSDSKLERQFSLLEEKTDFNICCHPSYTLQNETLLNLNYGKIESRKGLIGQEKIIEVSGGLMPMASIFIRTNALTKYYSDYPELYKKYLRHSAIQIISSISNGALYLNDTMAIYRSMHEGSWSLRNKKDINNRLDNFKEFIKRNEYLKHITENKYDHLFDKVKNRRVYRLIAGTDLTFSQSFGLFIEVVKLPIKLNVKLIGFMSVFIGIINRLIAKL